MKRIRGVILLCTAVLFLLGVGLLVYTGSTSEAIFTYECQRLKEAIQADSFDTITSIASSFRDNATPDIHDETGTPLLFYAKSLKVAEYLVERFDADITLVDSRGETLLHRNIREVQNSKDSRIPVLKYFLRLGLDPDKPDTAMGMSPRQLMRLKSCKGKEFPWDMETMLLVFDPENRLLAEHKYSYDHVFENPRVAIKPVEDSAFVAGYRFGYEFYAEDKEIVDGNLVLTFRGSMLNSSVSISIHQNEYDFESCEVRDGDWVCRNTSTGEYDTFDSPDVRLATEHPNINPEQGAAYPTTASGKNLQPDGRIILSCNAQIPDQVVVRGVYDRQYNFESIKLYYGNWVGKL